ncbi:MAG: FixH family protein [Acidimicrobiia bacterium]|nr:FixH family protein [Acidimicrobiia bacterium]
MRSVRLRLAAALLVSGLAAGCSGGEQRAPSAAAGQVEVAFSSQPEPPVTGDNTFEVTLMQGGQPVTDADVSVTFLMAAMPEVKMPEMRTSTPLAHDGGGRYRGMGNVMMSGAWDVTVVATRGGQQIASRTLTVTAQ